MNLSDIYIKYTSGTAGGDKGTSHSYIQHYEELIGYRQNESMNILEIGVADGQSLLMWKDYFLTSNIYGVDIDDKRQYSGDRIIVFHNDATLKSFLDVIESIKFDIIIDDGSHNPEDQILSYNLLFPYLNIGASYFIEDVRGIHIAEYVKQQTNESFIINNLLHERPHASDNILMHYIKTER